MRKFGGKVQVWTCWSGLNQKWTSKGAALVNGGGLCLDAHLQDAKKNGCRVQVWGCNQQTNQSWTFR
jgi:hypothetical protein